MNFKSIIEEESTINPPPTLKEATHRIEKLTGIKRSTTQVKKFLIKIGIKRRKVGQIPGKADPEIQEEYKKKILEPRLEEAKKGKRVVLFVDAAHFVMGAFLGFLWCFKRVFLKTPSGRKRYNVLGALNPLTYEVITVTNDSYINAITVVELLEKIRKQIPGLTITLFLDNARYQKCKLVWEKAQELGIELLYLPAYSPNLNLIERLWKWIKKKCLNSKYYENFESFKEAISNTIMNSHTVYAEELKTLLTLKFQIIDKSSILTS